MQTRRKLFYVFVLLFVLTAPLALLYTAGYRWFPESGLSKTGTLLLATTPRGATISVDGRERRDRSPSIVKWIRPGEHVVRMELEDHAPWEKTITVKSGETSFAEAVVLFSSDALMLAVPHAFVSAALSPNGRRLSWITTENGWTEVWVTDDKGLRARLAYRTVENNALVHAWSDDDHLIIRNASELLVQIDTRTNTTNTVTTTVTLTQEDTATVVRATSGNEIARLPKGEYMVVDERNTHTLLEQPSQRRIVLINRSDMQTPLHLVESALSYEWIGPQTLLYADAYAVQLYNTETLRSTTLTRLSQPLVAVHWTIRHPGYVFYATNTEVFAIEINGLGHRLTQSLGTLDAIEDIGTDESGRFLYVIGRNALDAGLFSRPLFHRSSPDDESQKSPEINIEERVYEIFQEDVFDLL
ncbi:hypothetical protein A3C17_04145 [Candidatus Uhrbacteria bacterium RIFCSPHIGHO2_02_FULL_53_13]|uniref:PEGA domain-containing protein n=2 Tax=Candidatus Uhriibacteriota TaxID=1752732 RepID=A0A1F7TWI3_9BACT|nr:MAG: hypothetical protein A3C17_04145 [Candidatus Uhrbacteria bacterium RIFCSPHIGHO2_02_FULL_53_13]OGL89900.1 MAG: hypothetical protein A3I45_00830 [Candidatus Uhrbacteria bacterium RIFCSPLOWO2_02_FULL_53_10]